MMSVLGNRRRVCPSHRTNCVRSKLLVRGGEGGVTAALRRSTHGVCTQRVLHRAEKVAKKLQKRATKQCAHRVAPGLGRHCHARSLHSASHTCTLLYNTLDTHAERLQVSLVILILHTHVTCCARWRDVAWTIACLLPVCTESRDWQSHARARHVCLSALDARVARTCMRVAVG